MVEKRLTVILLLLGIAFMVTQAVVAQEVTIPSHTETGEPLQLPGILHKPSGDGPFPAVVMLCACWGYGENSLGRKQQAAWAERLVGWGYVALQVDSFSPRGSPNGVCDYLLRVTPDMRFYDAYSAKSYLSTLPFVDPKNIAVIGWSHGGWTVMRIINRKSWQLEHAREVSPPFNAAVAFYPYCDSVLADLDTPLLVLIGAKDDWSPAFNCDSVHQGYRKTKYEFSLKIYPNAYHGFDFEGVKTEEQGYHIEYDPQATSDAIIRTRDFLAKYIGGK